MTFDAHNILPEGADRVFTNVLFFRDACTIRATLDDAGFDNIRIFGGWFGESVTNSSRLLVVRAERS